MTITPDTDVQKVFVPKDILPAITPELTYAIRYRVVSDNGVQVSDWSPKHLATKFPVYSSNTSTKTILNPTGTSPAKYSVSVVTKSHSESFDVSWKIVKSADGLAETPEQLVDINLDCYVRWGTNSSGTITWGTDWTYVTTTNSNSFSLPIPPAYATTISTKHVAQFMVHLATTDRAATETQYGTRLLLSDTISTDGLYNAGKIV